MTAYKKMSYRKRLVVGGLALILACGMLPASAIAEPEAVSAFASVEPLVSNEEQIEMLSRAKSGELIPSFLDPALYSYSANSIAPFANEILPSAFDLRNVEGKSYVSPVKLQNPWGSCWTFGSLAAVESNAMLEGFSDSNTDYSERHLG